MDRELFADPDSAGNTTGLLRTIGSLLARLFCQQCQRHAGDQVRLQLAVSDECSGCIAALAHARCGTVDLSGREWPSYLGQLAGKFRHSPTLRDPTI